MTREEKLQCNAARQKGVRVAWRAEQGLVKQGMGTRDWTQPQQKEILENGRAKGFVGHHMKSVNKYGQYADLGECNIQFLTKSEHIAAHRQGITAEKGFRCQTNGYYNHETGQTQGFLRAPHPPQAKALSERYQAPPAQQKQTQALAKKNGIEHQRGVH